MQNKKSLGQHWLKDRAILDEIADLALPDADADPAAPLPLCVEIGPGLGTLTSSLLKRFPKVVAIEYDDKLARNLPGSFPGKDLEVIRADFLKVDLQQFDRPYVVAGNIPYYITSPIITKLITAPNPPERIVLLVQKEVAERLLAKKYTYFSTLVQNSADVSPGPAVPKDYFTPPPKVDSAVIVLKPHAPVLNGAEQKLLTAGFSSPRKKLVKNLSAYPATATALETIGQSKDARPGDLSLKDWKSLAKILKIG